SGTPRSPRPQRRARAPRGRGRGACGPLRCARGTCKRRNAMTVKSITPYLMFDGTAEQAIELYQKALGAKVDGDIMRFEDAPGEGGRSQPSDARRVLHAQLRIGNAVLML